MKNFTGHELWVQRRLRGSGGYPWGATGCHEAVWGVTLGSLCVAGGCLWASVGHYKVYMGLWGGPMHCCWVYVGSRTSLWQFYMVYRALWSTHEFLWVAMGHLKKKKNQQKTKPPPSPRKLLKRTTKQINLKNKNECKSNKAD